MLTNNTNSSAYSQQDSISDLKNRLPSILSCTALKKESANSFCGPCIKCGGNDRFVYKSDSGKCWCRQCHEEPMDVIDFHCWLYGKEIKDLFREYFPKQQTNFERTPQEDPVQDQNPAIQEIWDDILKNNTNETPVKRLLCDMRKLSGSVVKLLMDAGKVRFKKHAEKVSVTVPFTTLQGKVLAIQCISSDGSDYPFTIKNGKPANKVFIKDSKPGEPCFFQCGMVINDASMIIITESAINAMTAYECFPEACCIALGSSGSTSKVKALKPYMDCIEKAIVCVDNDDPSEKMLHAISDILGNKVFSFEWEREDPPGYDINDLLQAGQKERIIDLIQNTKKVLYKVKEYCQNKIDKSIESPEPLPLERAIEKADPYPMDALGEIIGNAARIMNKAIQAPDGLCAHAVLGFATHTVQGHANVVIDGRIHPLNENFLSIGSRSARKTECDSKAGHLHKQFQRQSLMQYHIDRSAYLDEKEAYQEEKKKILNDKKKTLSEKNNALEALRENEPKGPYEPLMIFSDPTIEGIHGLFLRGTPSKYLCADEGGQVSGGHSMTTEKKTYTATTYSKYWDGAPIDRVRGGDGSSVLYGRRLSLHLMMQDKIAAEFFNDEIMRNQGLLSRFLCSFPESLAGQRFYQPWDVSDTSEMQRYYQQIQRNLEEPLPLREDEKTGDFLNELEPRTIYLEDDAKRIWIDAYEAIEAESGKGRKFESIEGFAGKACNHICRLAGIMAMFNDITRKTIPKAYVDNAIILMEYYLNERLRLTKMAEPNVEIEQAKNLLSWIQDKKLKTVSLPDVYQLGPSRFRNKNQAQNSIKILETHLWLIKIDNGVSELTGKKSNNMWEVNNGEI